MFACDAADLQENLDADQPVMAWSGDHAVTREGLHRLRSVAAERGYRVVPGHDPVVWPAFAGELGVEMLTEGTLGPDFHYCPLFAPPCGRRLAVARSIPPVVGPPPPCGGTDQLPDPAWWHVATKTFTR